MFELCHVVWIVAPGGPEVERLERVGLRPSFRREHPGQGTNNVCFCFDNAYLEVLFVENAAEASGAARRLRLVERVRDPYASPFGFAIRSDAPPPFATWDYAPTFLPPGQAFAVATESEDPGQPLVFVPPRSCRPDRWTDGRSGARQASAGFDEIVGLDLDRPAEAVPSAACAALERTGLLRLRVSDRGARLRLGLSLTDDVRRRFLVLPDAAWDEDAERRA